MKCIIILQAASCLCIAAEAICVILNIDSYRIVGIVALVVAAVFSLTACILQFRQNRTMKFLIRQTVPRSQAETNHINEILKKRIELSTLQSQINPHFLYNTLDSIRGEALSNHQPAIARMTEHLSRFFRYCISNQESIVKLSEELRHVDDYFHIQRYRFGEKLNLEVTVDDENLYEYYLPKITLQPIVENAIVHGLETVRRKGTVSIIVTASEHNLFVTVADNGSGMSQEELEKINRRLEDGRVEISVSGKRHTGIAIHNVNSRIRLCFGEEYGLHYRSAPGQGTSVEIVLPLIDDFNREEYERKLGEIE